MALEISSSTMASASSMALSVSLLVFIFGNLQKISIALQTVQVQRDTELYPIYASFPPTVLAVSGSRVRAHTPTLRSPSLHRSCPAIPSAVSNSNTAQLRGATLFVLRSEHSIAKNRKMSSEKPAPEGCRFSDRPLRCHAISSASVLPPRMWKCRCGTV